jgi:hypothetical protein
MNVITVWLNIVLANWLVLNFMAWAHRTGR